MNNYFIKPVFNNFYSVHGIFAIEEKREGGVKTHVSTP